jgi:hypothetical protein
VRGYLTIEETQEKSLFRAGDWKLTRTEKLEDDLLQYERTLLHGLFESGMEVQLSELHNTFAARMAKVQKALMNGAINASGSREADHGARCGCSPGWCCSGSAWQSRWCSPSPRTRR